MTDGRADTGAGHFVLSSSFGSGVVVACLHSRISFAAVETNRFCAIAANLAISTGKWMDLVNNNLDGSLRREK